MALKSKTSQPVSPKKFSPVRKRSAPVQVIDLVYGREIEKWTLEITKAYEGAKAAFFDLCAQCACAKRAFRKDPEASSILISRLPFSSSYFYKLAAVGDDPVLGDKKIQDRLPPEIGKLCILTGLDTAAKRAIINSKAFYPDLPVRKLKQLIDAKGGTEVEPTKVSSFVVCVVKSPTKRLQQSAVNIIERAADELEAKGLIVERPYQPSERKRLRAAAAYEKRYEKSWMKGVMKIVRQERQKKMKKKPSYLTSRQWLNSGTFAEFFDSDFYRDNPESQLDYLGRADEWPAIEEKARADAGDPFPESEFEIEEDVAPFSAEPSDVGKKLLGRFGRGISSRDIGKEFKFGDDGQDKNGIENE